MFRLSQLVYNINLFASTAACTKVLRLNSGDYIYNVQVMKSKVVCSVGVMLPLLQLNIVRILIFASNMSYKMDVHEANYILNNCQ